MPKSQKNVPANNCHLKVAKRPRNFLKFSNLRAVIIMRMRNNTIKHRPSMGVIAVASASLSTTVSHSILPRVSCLLWIYRVDA